MLNLSPTILKTSGNVEQNGIICIHFPDFSESDLRYAGAVGTFLGQIMSGVPAKYSWFPGGLDLFTHKSFICFHRL